MARYGPADCAITYATQSIANATVMGNFTKEMMLEEITPLGSAGAAQVYGSVGVYGLPEITIEAPYTDDQNLLADKLEDTGIGGTATLLIGWGGSKTSSVSTLLKRIEREIVRGQLTKVRGILQPTGVVTEV